MLSEKQYDRYERILRRCLEEDRKEARESRERYKQLLERWEKIRAKLNASKSSLDASTEIHGGVGATDSSSTTE